MKTILIADDEYSIVEALTDLLVDAGYRVVSGENGRAALAVIAEHRPDLVLTDLMMPGMDGRQLIRALRGMSGMQDTPVILMSAAYTPLGREEWPGITVLRKPFDIDMLLREIDRLLAEASGPRA
jgi:CheY-like chemotaxis protein